MYTSLQVDGFFEDRPKVLNSMYPATAIVKFQEDMGAWMKAKPMGTFCMYCPFVCIFNWGVLCPCRCLCNIPEFFMRKYYKDF